MKLKFISKYKLLAVALVGLSAMMLASPLASAQQASLQLKNADANLCYYNNTEWTLSKTSETVLGTSTGTVTWTVTVTKGETSDNFIEVHGFVSIYNGGSAPATIGNIVVNLQKRTPNNNNWVSVAADIADATNGDAATSALIVAAASQEDPILNALYGPPNYTVTAGKYSIGTFIETAGSGTLEFTDADNNTIWAISPEKTIPPGATVNLFYTATFDNTILGIPPTKPDGSPTPLRTETIVSFGNAGGRGGSGASAPNVDINGNGGIDLDEAWVRSVPTRKSLTLPPLIECNKTVTLTDPGVTTTGTVTATNFNNGGIGTGVTLADSATYTVTVDVDGGTDGGWVCNTAYLDSEDCCSITLQGQIIGYDPITGAPIYQVYTIPCCTGIHLKEESCVEVPKSGGGPPGGFQPGDFCTYTQGGWGNKCPPSNPPENPGCIRNNNFATVYPSGVEVGIPGTGGYSMQFTSAVAIQDYLPATETPGALTADLVNPTTSSSGVFGGQVLALELNVDFSAKNIPSHTGGPVGNLYYCKSGDSLNGKTVSEILAIANAALGGGTLPSGYTISDLNDLVDKLNNAFDNCSPDSWAQNNLSKTPCP